MKWLNLKRQLLVWRNALTTKDFVGTTAHITMIHLDVERTWKGRAGIVESRLS